MSAGFWHVRPHSWRGWRVTAICAVVLIIDGYDIGMYGAIVPGLLGYKPWALTPSDVALFASLTGIATIVGAVASGPLVAALGPRRVMVGCLVWFSIGMGAAALAPSATTFALFRVLTGLGFGAVGAVGVAMSAEFAPARLRTRAVAWVFIGSVVGTVIAAALALWIVPTFGFRGMLWAGVIPLAVAPLVYVLTPNSPSWLTSRHRGAEAEQVAARYGIDIAERPAHSGRPSLRERVEPMLMLLRGRQAVATVLFGLAGMSALLMVFALQTWLPTLMQRAGYGLGSALTFLLVFNSGALVGLILGSTFADRVAPRYAAISVYAIGAGACVLLSMPLSLGPLYVLVFLVGTAASAPGLTNGYVAAYYAPPSLPSAVGIFQGASKGGAVLGPQFGGFLLSAGISYRWNFIAFGAVALCGLILITSVPRRRAADMAPLAAPSQAIA